MKRFNRINRIRSLLDPVDPLNPPDPRSKDRKEPRTMTKLNELKLLTAWDIEPVLTEDELEDLLGTASKEDAAGLAPDDEGWEPTYDLNRAAAKAWLIKAARASATVDEPAAGVATSQVFENCLKMARLYSVRRAGTAIVS
jgi:hypothetical protein